MRWDFLNPLAVLTGIKRHLLKERFVIRVANDFNIH
jgi:hypothetical protein